MKLIITLHESGINSGIKKQASKGAGTLVKEILALESCFSSFLKKNHHFIGVKEVTISMTLCGRAKIRSLNKEYREKDKATDVLSFPIHENLRPDKNSKKETKNLPQVELGDLIICKEIAKAQAKEFKITYEQEIVHLAVHGFLHLLGFDHEVSAKEEKIMEKYESLLVKKIYKKIKAK